MLLLIGLHLGQGAVFAGADAGKGVLPVVSVGAEAVQQGVEAGVVQAGGGTAGDAAFVRHGAVLPLGGELAEEPPGGPVVGPDFERGFVFVVRQLEAQGLGFFLGDAGRVGGLGGLCQFPKWPSRMATA